MVVFVCRVGLFGLLFVMAAPADAGSPDVSSGFPPEAASDFAYMAVDGKLTYQAGDPRFRPDASPARTRIYVAPRVGRFFYFDNAIAPGYTVDKNTEHFGIGIGVQLGRYFAIEMGAAFAEPDLYATGSGKVAEYSTWNWLAEAKVMLPLLGDRLIPYIMGGGGASLTQINDTVFIAGAPVLTGDWEHWNPVWSFGVGVDWFLADNLSVNAELRAIHNVTEFEVDGADREFDASGIAASVGMRFYWPGLPFEDGIAYGRTQPAGLTEASWSGINPYVLFRAGVPRSVSGEPAPGFRVGGKGSEALLGGGIGVDINRHVGAEVVVEQQEIGIEVADPATGEFVPATELSTWSGLALARLRAPIGDGRFVPYMNFGAGLAFFETNDDSDLPLGAPTFKVDSWAPIFAAGLGMDIFIADNMALGIEGRYLRGRPEAKIGGMDREIDSDSFYVGAHLRTYLPHL